MAHIVARDPRQLTQLADHFKHSFAAEHGYLSSRHSPGETYDRTGVS
jgi:hypothetical protein